VEAVVAAAWLEGEGVVGEGVIEDAAEDPAFEKGAAFDGEIGFASDENMLMHGLGVFEDIKAVEPKKEKILFWARWIFFESPCNFLVHDTIERLRGV
jgi:hypothetical protein